MGISRFTGPVYTGGGFFIAVAAISALVACGGGGSSGASTTGNVSLSGKLNLAASSKPGDTPEDSVFSVNLNDYTAVCTTTTPPIKTGSAPVAADGSFSVTIAGAAGQPLACSLVDSSNVKKADFIISNSAKKDLNGHAQVTSAAAYAQSASVGTVNFDPNAGEVTIPSANIANSIVGATSSNVTVFDPSGTWQIGAVDFTVPTGIKDLCPSGSNNCDGPPAGQNVFLRMLKGKATSDNTPVYAVQLWDSPANSTACGGKLGLSTSQQSAIGVDFSELGAANAAFVFSTSLTGFNDKASGNTNESVNLTNNWQMNVATTNYDLLNCLSQDITVGGIAYKAYRCGPDTASHYQVNLGGGCTDTSSNPVQLTDWSGVGSCASTTDANGIQTQRCTGTATINGASTSVVCKNVWAVTDLSNNVLPSGSFAFSDLNSTKIAAGATCSSIGTANNLRSIQTLQCYSNYYYMSGVQDWLRSGGNACLPQIQTDWTSNDPNTFINVNFRPQGLTFMDQYIPDADGTGGSMLTRQEDYRGVQVTTNNYINCRTIQTGALTFKKINSNKILATYQSSTVTTSRDKPACVAAFSGTRDKYMFYLNKQ